jgi:hypothetical protein
MADAEHPDHAEVVRWYGGEYDLDDFDIDELNRVLREVTTGVFPEDLT